MTVMFTDPATGQFTSTDPRTQTPEYRMTQTLRNQFGSLRGGLGSLSGGDMMQNWSGTRTTPQYSPEQALMMQQQNFRPPFPGMQPQAPWGGPPGWGRQPQPWDNSPWGQPSPWQQPPPWQPQPDPPWASPMNRPSPYGTLGGSRYGMQQPGQWNSPMERYASPMSMPTGQRPSHNSQLATMNAYRSSTNQQPMMTPQQRGTQTIQNMQGYGPNLYNEQYSGMPQNLTGYNPSFNTGVAGPNYTSGGGLASGPYGSSNRAPDPVTRDYRGEVINQYSSSPSSPYSNPLLSAWQNRSRATTGTGYRSQPSGFTQSDPWTLKMQPYSHMNQNYFNQAW